MDLLSAIKISLIRALPIGSDVFMPKSINCIVGIDGVSSKLSIVSEGGNRQDESIAVERT